MSRSSFPDSRLRSAETREAQAQEGAGENRGDLVYGLGPSLRLSDKAAHLVNWHAGLQPCGRRGAGVPDAVPYMLLACRAGPPSPMGCSRWADALDPRHLSDVPSLHQGDLRGSRLGSIQATVKVSGQVSSLRSGGLHLLQSAAADRDYRVRQSA